MMFPLHSDNPAYAAGMEMGHMHSMMALGLPSITLCAARISNKKQATTVADYYGYRASYHDLDDYWCEANFTRG